MIFLIQNMRQMLEMHLSEKRQAGLYLHSVFYQYAGPRIGRDLRPKGQEPSEKSLDPCKSNTTTRLRIAGVIQTC